MAEQSERSYGGRAREAGEQVYAVALRATASLVVLVIFVGLAYLVNEGQLDGGALLLYAGVILGYVLSAAWRRK